MKIAVRNLLIAAAGCLLGISTATALDWTQCSTIEHAAERLACYDSIAAESAGRHISSNDWNMEKEIIISRCRTQMGGYGSAMVKACVDRDITAYEELTDYLDSFAAFIDRCKKQMGEYGWAMVKACADRDIAAERALGKLQNPQ